MRIFLTGATGYLGGALARRLVAEGHQLSAVVRDIERAAPLGELGVQLHRGDIEDRYSLREGMAGADWVVHSAALVAIDGDGEAMRRANVDGSENVASLAYKLGVGRFLSISSVVYFGGSPDDGSLADESAPIRSPFPSPYSATKHAGQKVIEEWAHRGLKVNTVYPGLIYGPPGKKAGANYLLRRIAKGRVPVLVGADRKASWVHLDDVVEALVRILAGAPPGRGYLLAGDVVTTGELVALLCRLAGVAPPRLRLSFGLARFGLGLAAPFYRLRGRRPPVAPGELASLERHWAFDDSRARQELGWQPRTLAEALPGMVDFLKT
ncbi:MAG TPA: NAD-dependent epimerase/dehydratase family protein [Thermoanaerobaculia bacterium]|nr:NAD-dependent epimerase/dehydratase family protein [Thermoanaerobaculia bacterium]